MDKLEIDWEQERPNEEELEALWSQTIFKSLDNQSSATRLLIDGIKKTHLNGGIHLHKYQLKSNKHFHWFASRNRLDEINFLQNTLQHKHLENYRRDVGITNNTELSVNHYSVDMYEIPGKLASILAHGGAYKNLHPKEAWKTSTKFVKSEFDYRFDEVLVFDFNITNASWFYGVAWDVAILLFDKRKHTITIISITDTD